VDDNCKKSTNPKDALASLKAPFGSIPRAVLDWLGVAMLEGVCKHGSMNYRIHGVRASVYYDALNRHSGDWWEGQDIDYDSPAKLHNILKAIATLVVLYDGILQGVVTDDRPPPSKNFRAELNAAAAQTIASYAHLTPRHYTRDDTVVFQNNKDEK